MASDQAPTTGTSTRGNLDPPQEVRAAVRRGVRIAWAAIAFQLSAVVLVYLAMGSSAAMKAAWIEDTLGLVPPVAFLVALHRRRRDPSRDFPWGHGRTSTVAFLVASGALAIFGIYIVYDSAHHLLAFEHTTIGTMVVLGEQVWAGWPMVAVMAYTIGPAVAIGHVAKKTAQQIHDKSLYAEGEMLRADWMTAGGTIVGVLLVGAGFWWADGVVALAIGLDVVHDGWTYMKGSITDLEDQRPRSVDEERFEDLDEEVAAAVADLPWVDRVAVRLRENGQGVVGEIWVVPTTASIAPARLREAQRAAHSVSWRIQDVVVVPTDALDADELAFSA